MLAWATRYGREAAVTALLRLGLDAATQDLDGETPLRLAVLAGAVDAVDALLHAGALSGRPTSMATPRSTLRWVRPTAVCVNGSRGDCSRRAPLRVSPCRSSPSADAMFERAADAIASGDVAGLSALLDEEPSLAQARSARLTARRCCITAARTVSRSRDRRRRLTDPELARLLLDRGADANATCLLYGGGATALGLALSSTHPVRAGSRRRLTEVLLRAGARLDSDRAHGNLSAMAALGDLDDLGDLDGVRQRLDPARVTRLPEATHVQTAFWWACEFGRTAVADHLLDRGADIGARNGNGQTGLHLAASNGWLETVQRLLARGAPLEIENAWGGRRSATSCGRRCTTTRMWTTRRSWRP